MQRPAARLLGPVRRIHRGAYRCSSYTVSSECQPASLQVRRYAQQPNAPKSKPFSEQKSTNSTETKQDIEAGIPDYNAFKDKIPNISRNALGKAYDSIYETWKGVQPKLSPAVVTMKEKLAEAKPHVDKAVEYVKPMAATALEKGSESAKKNSSKAFAFAQEKPKETGLVAAACVCVYLGYKWLKGGKDATPAVKVTLPHAPQTKQPQAASNPQPAAASGAASAAPGCQSCAERHAEDDAYRAALKELVTADIPSLLEDLSKERNKMRELNKELRAGKATSYYGRRMREETPSNNQHLSASLDKSPSPQRVQR